MDVVAENTSDDPLTLWSAWHPPFPNSTASNALEDTLLLHELEATDDDACARGVSRAKPMSTGEVVETRGQLDAEFGVYTSHETERCYPACEYRFAAVFEVRIEDETRLTYTWGVTLVVD